MLPTSSLVPTFRSNKELPWERLIHALGNVDDQNAVVESFVAFIDLLGFGDANTPEEFTRLYGSLEAIRHEFEFRPREKSTREAHEAVEKHVLMFSDCIVVSIPARSPYTKLTGKFDLFVSELHGLALSQGVCALKHHFVRGVVDIGLVLQGQLSGQSGACPSLPTGEESGASGDCSE
jgi:hypothetical protein